MENTVFGTIVEPTRNATVAVGATSVSIAEARSEQNKRKVLHIKNVSTDTSIVVTVNFGFGIAAVNTGVVLNAGEAVTDTSESGYECYQGMVMAIASAAGGSVAIFER